MQLGHRNFLFEPDGTIRRIAQRVMDGMCWDRDRMPQYAGQRLRYAVAFLALHQGKPVEIVEIQGSYLEFDRHGRIGGALLTAARERMNVYHELENAATSGPVIDVSARIRARRMEETQRWQPTPAEVTQLVHAIWPETAGRPHVRPKFAPGVRRRKPHTTS